MNIHIKKLITFLTLEPRTDVVSCLIGYLNSLDVVEYTIPELINYLIVFDKAIMRLFEEDNNEARLKDYSILLNKCYSFINAEYSISFIKQPAFDDNRVANIKDYKRYVLVRGLSLNEYEANKGVST